MTDLGSDLIWLKQELWENLTHAWSPVTDALLDRWATYILNEPTVQMGYALDYWFAYFARMFNGRDRYLAAGEPYRTSLKVVVNAPDNSPVAQDASLLENIAVGWIQIPLAIESFYVSTKLLLERIAITFGFFFGANLETSGSGHHSLSERFPKMNSRIAPSTNTPANFHGKMKWLNRNVVSFRNIHIEHPPHPSLGVHNNGLVEQPLPDDTTYLAAHMRPEDGKKLSFTLAPDHILGVVDAYMSDMLKYFDDHHQRSIFGSDPIDWKAQPKKCPKGRSPDPAESSGH